VEVAALRAEGRERLRRDVHERRPRGNRRNRQKLIHLGPTQGHAQRLAPHQKLSAATATSTRREITHTVTAIS
jgi:hypothetical protein